MIDLSNSTITESSASVLEGKCGTCKYFVTEGDQDIQADSQGRCFRFPRQRSLHVQQNALGQTGLAETSNYPLQQGDNWCGEYLATPMVPVGRA